MRCFLSWPSVQSCLQAGSRVTTTMALMLLQAGSVTSIVYLMSMVISPFLGRTVDYYGRRAVWQFSAAPLVYPAFTVGTHEHYANLAYGFIGTIVLRLRGSAMAVHSVFGRTIYRRNCKWPCNIYADVWYWDLQHCRWQANGPKYKRENESHELPASSHIFCGNGMCKVRSFL